MGHVESNESNLERADLTDEKRREIAIEAVRARTGIDVVSADLEPDAFPRTPTVALDVQFAFYASRQARDMYVRGREEAAWLEGERAKFEAVVRSLEELQRSADSRAASEPYRFLPTPARRMSALTGRMLEPMREFTELRSELDGMTRSLRRGRPFDADTWQRQHAVRWLLAVRKGAAAGAMPESSLWVDVEGQPPRSGLWPTTALVHRKVDPTLWRCGQLDTSLSDALRPDDSDANLLPDCERRASDALDLDEWALTNRLSVAVDRRLDGHHRRDVWLTRREIALFLIAAGLTRLSLASVEDEVRRCIESIRTKRKERLASDDAGLKGPTLHVAPGAHVVRT